MSNLQRKMQYAREKGVYVFKLPAHIRRVRRAVEEETSGRMTTRMVKITDTKEWAVYVEGEWSPRISLTKREAVALAYSLSNAPKPKLEINVYQYYAHKGAMK